MRALSRIALLSTLVAVSATPSFAQSLTAGPEILVTTAGYLHVREAAPAIALRSDGGFVSVWRDSRSIHTRAFAASDAPLSAARKLSSAGPDSPRLAALASGGFVAVWTGYRPPTPPTYTGDGTIVVQLLDSAGNRLGSPQELDNGSGVAEGVGDPAVAAEPDGGFVVVWNSARRILARRFDSHGTPVTGEMILASASGFLAVTALPGGGFAVSRLEFISDVTGHVRMQVSIQAFAADGTPVGPQTIQASALAVSAAISADASGHFIAAWTEQAGVQAPYRVFARRFSPSGQPLGDPIPVGSTPSLWFSAYVTSVAARPDGSFLVVWGQEINPISSGPASLEPVEGDVWARAYTATGESLGAAFLVHDGAAGEQHDGQAVAAADGWLVTWMQRLDGSRVAARRLTLACGAATAICLNGDRFRAEVAWKVPSTGAEGIGTPIPLTDDTGSFWFFTPANYELAVKVLDGRALNGHFWVFYGSLTDVEFDLTVTDTATGQVRTYHNPAGTMASRADTLAF